MHPPNGYRYLSLLGNGQATIWLAENFDGVQFVIKTLELKNVSDWKGIELFEREVNVLQQLDHPSIPKFIDFIKDEYEGAKRWHIIQEKVEGVKPDPVWFWSEDKLRKLASNVLESLVYLQSFSPPLLHRDIKPDNLIRKERGYALTDFGSVRHVIPSDVGGSTLAGTSGYMAPEQLMGRADKGSDLYGLGTTLIHLISGKHPDDLETKRMQIQWSDYHGELSEIFVSFVNQLTEPHSENRFDDAQDALVFLRDPGGPPKNLIRHRKSWCTISVNQEQDEIQVYGTTLEVRHFNAFVEFFMFLLILIGLLILTQVPPLFFGVTIGMVFISLVKIKRVNVTIRCAQSGVEMDGVIEDGLLSKLDQGKLDNEVRKLSLRYLEERVPLGIEHKRKMLIDEEEN